MFGSTQHAVFPNSPAGLRLVLLLIPSPVISFISFIVSKPLGSTSMYLIPAAFFLTTIHHTVIRVLLARKPRATTNINSPSEERFKPLHHIANIYAEGLLAALWLAGGIASIFVNVSKWKKSSPQDLASAGLAILEAGLVVAMAVYSWKLRKEARVCRMVPAVIVLNSESASLIEESKMTI
ncbi:unnamed protein product [Rhizoctonia solani]|uniref:Uncharacterized protein n=1 Tax=Rhizoctonia solani TaxID=456999 RepID=A0A8H3HA84_9AGAM|nr:unnamed protein product [Rhizoctonia solani]